MGSRFSRGSFRYCYWTGEKHIEEIFAACPILEASDVEVPGWWQSRSGQATWTPRRYTHTIQYAQRLSQTKNSMYTNATIPVAPEEVGKWERFTDPRLLASHIVANFVDVRFRRTPGKPFVSVQAADFEFESPPSFTALRLREGTGGLGVSEPQHEDEQIEQPHDSPTALINRTFACRVDYKETCCFGVGCILLPAAGSMCCTYHHRLIVYSARVDLMRKQYAPEQQLARASGYDDSVDFVRPALDKIGIVREVYITHSRFHIWTVDCEFGAVRNAHCIPWIITIRDVKTGEIILSTPVNYENMELSEVEDAIRAYQLTQLPAGGVNRYCTAEYFTKFYNATNTNGMTLAAIGEAMRAASFKPSTHRVWSWYSAHDTIVLLRALRGINSLIDQTYINDLVLRDRGDLVFQPYNISRLINDCSTLTSSAYGWTHRSLFRHNLSFHDPEQDTLVNACIYNESWKQTCLWVEEMREDEQEDTDNQ